MTLAADPVRVERWLGRAPGIAALPAGSLLACSGGTDSLALVALAAATHANFLVVHVDHGLRPGGAAEAEAVAAAAARFGLPMVATTAEVTPGPNLEARARAARYDALRALAAPAIAVAHTADDQAETVMINLLRGAALAGLAGMAPIRDDIHRPLLGLRRSDTEAICAAFGFEPFVDPTNADRRFLRNRVRLELLPQLESMASRDLVPVLARQATVLRSEHEFLDELAVAAWPTADDPHPETPRVADLVRLPEVLARRAVRRWLGSPPAALDEVDAVLTVARGGRVAVELAGRGRIARSQGRLFRR